MLNNSLDKNNLLMVVVIGLLIIANLNLFISTNIKLLYFRSPKCLDTRNYNTKLIPFLVA